MSEGLELRVDVGREVWRGTLSLRSLHLEGFIIHRLPSYWKKMGLQKMNSGESQIKYMENMTHSIRDTKSHLYDPLPKATLKTHMKGKDRFMYKPDRRARPRNSRHVRAEAQAHPDADRGY